MSGIYKDFDVIVIGAGPGGYIAAIRASQLGLKTAVVEAEAVGGTCLNWGCIATKALLASSDVLRTIRGANKYGISVEGVSFDYPAIVARSRKIIQKMAGGIKFLFKKHNIELISGYARLQGAGKVEVSYTDKEDKDLLKAPHIILATGARPSVIDGIETDGELILNSRQTLLNTKIPENLLIVGGGAIGLEFADLYSAFGSKVTLVEKADRIIPFVDAEIAEMATASFSKQGMEIITGTGIKSLHRAKSNSSESDKVEALLVRDNTEEKRIFDMAIVGIGVTPNLDDIGLDTVDVEIDKGHIVTNEWFETKEKGLYAIGDIGKVPFLAHKASAEGIVCVEKLSGLVEDIEPLNYKLIPSCIYSTPQISGFGFTEENAVKAGFEISVGRFPMQANGKATTSGHTEGMIKVIVETKTKKILGAWLIGYGVSELIGGLIPGDIWHKIFPHPTLSEIIPESLLNAYDLSLNI